jgi:hypothetical protein
MNEALKLDSSNGGRHGKGVSRAPLQTMKKKVSDTAKMRSYIPSDIQVLISRHPRQRHV